MAIGLDKWPYPDGGLGNAGQWNDIDLTNGLYSLVEYDGLYGTSGADKIAGTNKGDWFSTFGGADILKGMGGADRIHGGDGKVQLTAALARTLLSIGKNRSQQ